MRTVIVVPTRNEAGNIPELIRQICYCLNGFDYELVFVDDSTDITPQVIESMGCRVIKGRHLGLAQAVLDGIYQTQSDNIIVMDSDLQHPPKLLPHVIDKLKRFDLVMVTKHGKGADDKLSASRKLQSWAGVMAAKKLIPSPVSDPMSGFFGIRRSCLEGVELEGIGFKIGLEIVVKAKWVSHYEIPMQFGERQSGESKGTAHSLQKHLFHLWKWHLTQKIELPNGSQEYYAFYEGGDWQKIWKQQIALILQKITYKLQPRRLLDVGCGSSPNLNYMFGKEKIGIDVRLESVKFMQTHSQSTYRQGSVLAIPFNNESFDVVSCVEVVEHLYPHQVKKALSEISRVLKAGGYAIIATPNYSSMLWNIIENSQHILQPNQWTSDHHTKLNRHSLRDLLMAYGLKEFEFQSVMAGMDMVATYQKGEV